jgi:hypothetical protein
VLYLCSKFLPFSRLHSCWTRTCFEKLAPFLCACAICNFSRGVLSAPIVYRAPRLQISAKLRKLRLRRPLWKMKRQFCAPFLLYIYIYTRIEQRKVSLKLSSLSRNRARHCFYAACVKSCFFLHPLLLLHCCLACWRARLYFYDVFVVFHSQII